MFTKLLRKIWGTLKNQTGAIQLKDTIRNARLDTIESTGGTTCAMQIRTGAQPADCATANAGTLLWDINLPSDWMGVAAAGVKAKSGTWSGAASAAGTAGHFRIFNNQTTKDNTTCIMQGSVGQGTGDLSLDNTVIANGQTITINTFSLQDANA
jgi:hypothetical protein